MEIKGVPANPGVVSGKIVIIPEFVDLKEIEPLINQGDIVVAKSASPKLVVLYRKAGALVVEQGGLLSHAVKISRELKIPCVIGADRAVEIFQTGDLVEVDANKGIVRILEK